MKRVSGTFVAALALLFCALSAHAQSDLDHVTSKARAVEQVLESLDVEHRWIAGHPVNWETGEPEDSSEILPGRHTHCSAFVASAAKRLGIYILRPPRHGQILLANAQNEWLAEEGAREGWRPVGDALEAQALANAGDLVVASYHSHDGHKPGHIAIVLPGDKGKAEIEAEGPNVIQAGTVNSASISLKSGFAGHPHAWGDHEVEFFAHAIER